MRGVAGLGSLLHGVGDIMINSVWAVGKVDTHMFNHLITSTYLPTYLPLEYYLSTPLQFEILQSNPNLSTQYSHRIASHRASPRLA